MQGNLHAHLKIKPPFPEVVYSGGMSCPAGKGELKRERERNSFSIG